MTDFLPEALAEELCAARLQARRKASRLQIVQGDERYPVLRVWGGGFSLEADLARRLRGLVELHQGGRQLFQCLIVATEEEDGEIRFEYKRRTGVSDRPPPDFARPTDAPAGLLTSG